MSSERREVVREARRSADARRRGSRVCSAGLAGTNDSRAGDLQFCEDTSVELRNHNQRQKNTIITNTTLAHHRESN